MVFGAVLKILYNPCKSLCLQINAEVSIIAESVRGDLTFIFIETSDSFVKLCLVLKIKNSIGNGAA